MVIKQKITTISLSILLLSILVYSPAFADCPETSIIKVACDNEGGGIWGILDMIITIMTTGVVIVAVGGVLYGAILWTTAADDSGKIQKSKEVIFNVVMGLVAFALMYAFLQYLIPGGVF
jgi:hypothetical protein